MRTALRGSNKLLPVVGWSNTFIAFLQKCLHNNPQQRASAAELASDEFLVKTSISQEGLAKRIGAVLMKDMLTDSIFDIGMYLIINRGVKLSPVLYICCW